MKSTAIIVLTLAMGACAHASQPYAFTTAQTPNDLDVLTHALESNGYKVASVDPALGTITTYWFDSGYHFREADDFANQDRDQYTDIFLRYRVSVQRSGGQDNVVVATDVQRCSPLDSYVTASGVNGTCLPLDKVFPTQQQQANVLGNKLREALASHS